jgi:monoterpene epsilon-lactone hydrolase
LAATVIAPSDAPRQVTTVLRFILSFWTSVVLVAFARLLRGPLLPTWSFGYEVVTRAQKRFHERVARLPPAKERRAWGSLRANGPALKQVTWSRSTLGSVEAWSLVPRDLPRTERVVLYLHGGSFIYGSERSHGELCARLAIAARARLVFPLYRLAPEHPFPAALDDALAVYRALLAERIASSSIVVAGDSAGGNLALSLLVALRDAGDPLPARAVLISPWVDLMARDGSMQANEPFDWASPWMFDRWRHEYVQQSDPEDPRVSPAFADLRGLPPLLIQIGTAELLHDQVVALARRASAAGVVVRLEEFPELTHLWHSLAPLFPRLQEGMDRIGDFVRGDLPLEGVRGTRPLERVSTSAHRES